MNDKKLAMDTIKAVHDCLMKNIHDEKRDKFKANLLTSYGKIKIIAERERHPKKGRKCSNA